MYLTAESELEVVKHGLYDPENERMGHFIDLTDGQQTYRYTIGRDALERESIPAPGSTVSVVLEAYRRPSARTNRQGEAYVKWETKYRIVSFSGALAQAA